MVSDGLTVGFVGFDQLTTLPDRLVMHYSAALVPAMAVVADSVIHDAQSSLVPGHGYDTGLLHDSLTKELVELALGAGVFYILGSDAADYWVYVEFGHMLRNGAWWPGYHFLENALEKNRELLYVMAHEAWTVTADILNAESEVMLLGDMAAHGIR